MAQLKKNKVAVLQAVQDYIEGAAQEKAGKQKKESAKKILLPTLQDNEGNFQVGEFDVLEQSGNTRIVGVKDFLNLCNKHGIKQDVIESALTVSVAMFDAIVKTTSISVDEANKIVWNKAQESKVKISVLK